MTDSNNGPEIDPTTGVAPKKGKKKAQAAEPTTSSANTADAPDDTAVSGAEARRVAAARPQEPIDPLGKPEHAMAKKIWDSQPKVQIAVPKPKGQKAPPVVILAEINGVQWHGIPGRTHVVPAEVARIAIQAGLAVGEMHPDFADELSYEGPVLQIAEHSDPRFQADQS